MPLKDVIDVWRKLDKAKLVALVMIGSGALYLFIRLQETAIQKSMVDVTNSYTQEQPIDMCVQKVTIDHNIFPPKFGAQVVYNPCSRELPTKPLVSPETNGSVPTRFSNGNRVETPPKTQ